jgi:hypothetical protein
VWGRFLLPFMTIALGTLLLIAGTYILGRNRQVAARLGMAGHHPSDWQLRTSVARQNIVTIGAVLLAAGLTMMFLI